MRGSSEEGHNVGVKLETMIWEHRRGLWYNSCEGLEFSLVIMQKVGSGNNHHFKEKIKKKIKLNVTLNLYVHK